MRFLRKNTAVLITVGPFYDKTDGVTIETALTITNERITLTADTDDGSAPTNILDNITGATSGTDNDLNYITNNDAGMMQLELSMANVNRLGRMFLSITDAANHVPVFHEFMVVNAALYDAFFATSGGAIPNAVAGAAGGVFIAGTNAATAVTTALTANITGNLSGSVGSVTGAVGSVTGAVGSVTGSVGSVTGAVGSVAAGGITAASIATNAIDADALATDAVTEITNGVWAKVIEGAVTATEMVRGFASVLLSKASGLETTSATYRDIGDTKDRVTATVDASGNRTAITRDLT